MMRATPTENKKAAMGYQNASSNNTYNRSYRQNSPFVGSHK